MIYSSRIEVKQWMRDLERLLTNVEKLETFATLLGATTDEDALASAWDPVLFPPFGGVALRGRGATTSDPYCNHRLRQAGRWPDRPAD